MRIRWIGVTVLSVTGKISSFALTLGGQNVMADRCNLNN